jgi:gliding motility-associated-like protein
MKKLLFLVLLFSNFFGFAQQYTLIPDLNFEQALINRLIDTGVPDGRVLTANIIGLTDLSLSGENITNLTGIQSFVSLKNLQCGQNLFTSIDLSKNTSLEYLDCTINKLTSLDVSKNLKLTNLVCEGSPLTNLDVSKNTALKYLNCGGCQLTTLDVSKNAALGLLICRNNQLTSLDVSNNKSLLYINCIYNNLINLNLKNGNNVTMGGSGVLLQFNPNLTCIQVDDAAYSDTYWSYNKDATAKFSEDCSKIAAIAPPKITATGNQNYCPGTSLPIVESVRITFDPLEPTTDAVTIQISSGYIFGQDSLTLIGTNLGIASTWVQSEGKLNLYSLSGKLPYAAFESAIKNVMFSNSATSPSGTRNYSISLGTGQLSYLPSNKHFYEYVSNFGITWSDAKVVAAGRNYYGLQGYLATLTSAAESQLAGAQASGAGWIGGSDTETEGTWKWVTGPEGLANGGTGTTFWIGGNNGTTTAPNNYANWNTPNEPNNTTNNSKPYGEDYAHITAPAVGRPGTWNDLANQGDPSGNYQAKGYIVEYGGMIPGDVDAIQISASTTITMAKITTTLPNPICASSTSTLQASPSAGTINWYDAATNGNLLKMNSNSYTTPQLYTTTTYYIDNGCSVRTPITVTVNPSPIIPTANNIFYCQNETAIPLVASASAFCTLNWYNSDTGGIANFNPPTPATATVSTNSYFVSQTITATGCEGPRTEIKVTINPLPLAPSISPISYCTNSTATALTAIASANCNLNWYNAANGGTATSSSPIPLTSSVGTISYFVSQTITSTGCEGPRAELKVTINALPLAPIVNNVSLCFLETASPLNVIIPSDYALNWYTTATSLNASSTNPTPLTATVSSTSYYVSQYNIISGCESLRSEIKTIVNPLPIVNDVTIIQCDSDLVPDGKTFFNLTIKNDEISTNYTNEDFTYYSLQSEANNGTNKILNELAFENTTDSMMDIWARVANKTTGCFSVAKITLKVPATNILPSFKISVPPVCDDFLDVVNNNQDGIATFDFSSTKAVILSQTQTINQNYTLNYYQNKADALSKANEITNISNYRNIGYPNSQDIWVRVESSLDNSCVGLGPYITLNVESLPNINLNTNGGENYLVCSNLPTFFVTLDAGIQDGSPTTDYTYTWSKDGSILIGKTAYTLPVNTVGTYTVEVKNVAGCSSIRNLKVTASDLPHIDSIAIVDMTDTNTVTVNVSGKGKYEYSLDEPNGFWQDSNFFDNVPAGIHDVYINDKDGCGVASKTIAVIGAPKFFTPNNDGYNDYWSVKGINDTFNSKSIIYIYDRYGKLLKQWVPSFNQGWDGLLNGNLMPADDYWYTLRLEDGREAKGHFSLKR